ncbi:MAG: hypothetical protein K2X43_09965 [Hyphomonadaceae bacterium]|nr:hypothetical protein [Hyphomonadaceae bacterium]
MKRNPRRAYDREGREIQPPTIGQLRQEGDTTAAVYCHARGCHQSATISTDRFPADLPFPDIGLRLRCSVCGSREVSVMRDTLALAARAQAARGWRAGSAGPLPAHYQVVGRDVPWPDEPRP